MQSSIARPTSISQRFERVTPADVNRVAQRYMSVEPTIAYAVPKNNGEVGSGSSGKAPENNTIVPSHQEPLPSWAESLLTQLHVPARNDESDDQRAAERSAS